MYIIDIKLQRPDGSIERVRKVSPAATLRGARAYELELRSALLAQRSPPGGGSAMSIPPTEEEVTPRRRGAAKHTSEALRVDAEDDEEDVTTPPASARPRRTKAAAKPEPRAPTLADFVPEFMRYQASPGASRRGANKPGELREKQRIFDNHLLPAFGSMRLDAITARRIDLYIADKSAPSGSRLRRRSKFGEPLAAATVANHVILLRRVLSVAHRWELIDRVPPITCPAADTPRTDFLTFEEAERLIAAAAPEWRVLIHLAIRTGLRLGELRALRWSDLHLDVGYLRVEQNLTKAGYGAPKSGRARTVDLAVDAREALRGHPQTPSREGLVFCQPGGTPVTEGQVYRAVKAAAQGAGLRRNVHPHLLRHTFASHCVMRGIPLAVVKEWLGHAESRMTERYAHLAPEVRAGYINRLAAPASAAVDPPATGSRGNGPVNLLASRGNIGATATAPKRKTLSRVP